MQLSNATDTPHFLMNNTTGTLFRQQSPTQKVFRFPGGEQALVIERGLLCFSPPTPLSLSPLPRDRGGPRLCAQVRCV